MEIKRITILIGPQAQGKSVITKLVSFFKDFPYMVYESGMEGKSKRQFDAELRAKFESMFPRYTWGDTDFHIGFASQYFWCNIEFSSGKLAIVYSEAIPKALASARKIMQKANEDTDSSRPRKSPLREIRDSVLSHLASHSDEPRMESIIYIPAGRSFFANLHKNVFTFLSSNIPIDYFLKDFGSIYERTRDLVTNGVFGSQPVPKAVAKLVDDLVCGKYLAEKGQDWIVGSRGKVSVSNSSSGQQEVLPMALMLSTWPYVRKTQVFRSFVIEEPEAHLFPVAQSQIVSLIATAYGAGDEDSDYIVTTHSPYILAAFNNLIQARNVFDAIDPNNKGELNKLFSVVPREQMVDFDDVSAYMVTGGNVAEMLDSDLRLIDAGAIDEVSNVISERFEKLLQMEVQQ